LAVSPGVAVGTAYCIHDILIDPDRDRLETHEVASELAAYEAAREGTLADLRALQGKVERQVGHQEAAIFAVHEAILRDRDFTHKVQTWIVEDHLSAGAALHRLLEHYSYLFARTRDGYLRERLNDVRDVIQRISGHLNALVMPRTPLMSGPLILVADEFLPSHAVAIGTADVRGIVTQTGSRTSHAAIIARARGIPAVSGVSGILRHVKSGDTVIVDGREGQVIVNPDAEAKSAYRKLEREFFLLKDQLAANRDQPARTIDGVELELLANVNGVTDAAAAAAMGATAVGLFRTEYIYLTHPDIPSEEEQYEVYCRIVDASPARRVTIRTLDIGGDKTVPYLGHHHQEANPFLGWRSIRLSFEHPDFFNTQIRAILRAAAYAGQHSGRIRLMFPMITTLEEIHRVRQMVRRVKERLRKARRPFADVPMGIMVEVPAAAVSIRAMLPVIDFVSIGSNDLIQYLMAADRDNPKVSHLCQPIAPPVLRVLADVIAACNAASKPVTLCGEMAGQPRSFVLLLGMGLRSFSMSPAFIPSIKELAHSLTVSEAKVILDHAIKLKTTGQIKRYLTEQLRRISPNLGMLETE
jgi:phosphotransferase system enzyme I (PtsI)